MFYEKTALFLTLIALVLALCACGPEVPAGTHKPANAGNSSSTRPSSNIKTDECKDGHTFTDTGVACEKCGIDYFSATLEFKLNDTRDSYTLIGLGTCTRTVIHVPETYKNKPITEIATTAFNAVSNPACNEITEIVLPASVVTIHSNAFFKCEKLSKVSIPNGVTTIGADAFRGCTALESIRLPDALEEISDGLFWECTSLMTVDIPVDSIWHIGSNAFNGCAILESLTIPDSVTKIDTNAFANCSALRSLRMSSNIENLGRNTFTGCDSLEYNIYNGMGYLGNDANPYVLLMCVKDPAQKEVIIHENTKTVLYEAFTGATITSLTLGKNLTFIPYGGLDSLTSLETISVAEGNPKYHTAGNCLIETETKILIRGTGTSVIPSDGSVTIIGSYAFSGIKGLTSIYIPDSITVIQGMAFHKCAELTTVIIGKSLQSVELNGFSGCSSLAEVFYEGTASEWNKIDIPKSIGGGGMSFGDNKELLDAERYYFSEEQPTGSGKYWHYVDGKPTPWEAAE